MDRVISHLPARHRPYNTLIFGSLSVVNRGILLVLGALDTFVRHGSVAVGAS
ncbi:MAG: hypothetical protein ACPGWR_03310 [Ardenticatenaceae bacterium]